MMNLPTLIFILSKQIFKRRSFDPEKNKEYLKIIFVSKKETISQTQRKQFCSPRSLFS